MNFSQLTHRLSGLYYGWRMIGVVWALRILGGGLHQYGFTVFFLPVTQDLGLTRAMTSLAFSLARAEGAIESPIVGYLLDRHGPKPIMLAATVLAGIGYVLFAFVDSYAQFLIVYLGVISLAFTAGFVHAPTVVANTWFTALRARAMTVVSSAVPIGGAIITPLLAMAVANFGWRPTAMIAGAMFLAGGVPLALRIKRSPESIGIAPGGAALTVETAARADGASTGNRTSEPQVSARQALRMPIFWIMILSMAARGAAFTTVTTHFIPLMVWKGLTQNQASVLLAGFAVMNLLMHFVLGWIADSVNKPKLVTLCITIGVIAVVPMMWSDRFWALWLFTALYPVLDASIPVYWAAVGDFFGRKSYGAIRGNMNLFYTWGSIFGPVIAGAVYDRTESYAMVFTGMTIALLISALLTALLIKPWARLARAQHAPH